MAPWWMPSHQLIKQSGHAMHSWHDDVGRVATAAEMDLGWWS